MEADNEAVEQTPQEKIADMMFGPEHQGEPEAPQEAAEEPIEEEAQAEGQEEENEPQEAAEEPSEPEFVEIEIDGQLYEVPKNLEGHLMRDKDYTQKTQEVAATRKTVEAIQAQVKAEQEKYQFLESVQEELQQGENLKAQIAQIQQYKRDNIDALDAKDMFKLDAHREELQTQLDAIGQSLQTKQGEFQQAQEQSLKELLDKSTEVLRSKIPNWGEESQKQVRDFGLSAGFTEAELNQVYDPRYVEILYKASQYDLLQQGKGAAIKKVQAAPAIKPKARNPMPKSVGDKLNLRKKMKAQNVSQDAKGKALGAHIAERFKM